MYDNIHGCFIRKKLDCMFSVLEVASYIIEKRLPNMTHKKLQKLCYYIQAWSLAILGKKMIDTNFEAWVHGPVSRQLYKSCKNGLSSLNTISHNIGDNDKDFINMILDMYSNFTGRELEELTHSEPPWIEARKGLEFWELSNNIISEDLMTSFYRNLLEKTLKEKKQ